MTPHFAFYPLTRILLHENKPTETGCADKIGPACKCGQQNMQMTSVCMWIPTPHARESVSWFVEFQKATVFDKFSNEGEIVEE